MGGSESKAKRRSSHAPSGHSHTPPARGSAPQHQHTPTHPTAHTTPNRARAHTTSQHATPNANSRNSPGDQRRVSGAGGAGAGVANLAAAGGRPQSREEMLQRVRDAIVMCHDIASSLGPDAAPGLRAEWERRLGALLSYEEAITNGAAVERAQANNQPGNPQPASAPRLHPLINRCPIMQFADQSLEGSGTIPEDRRTCAVCWEDYQPGETILVMPCFHWLHNSCGRDWLARSPECPICRLNVVDALSASGAGGGGDSSTANAAAPPSRASAGGVERAPPAPVTSTNTDTSATTAAPAQPSPARERRRREHPQPTSPAPSSSSATSASPPRSSTSSPASPSPPRGGENDSQ